MPVWIGERLVLLFPHEDPSSAYGRPHLIIDPGGKFGTGTHPTTRICLTILEGILREEQSVLDVGTGTGILAIYAATRASREVVAIDLDFEACRVCRGNIMKNGLNQKVRIINGRVEALSDRKLFDVVVANLGADTLTGVLPALGARVPADGFIVISGVPAGAQSEFLSLVEKASLKVLSSVILDQWAGFLLMPNGK
ncbi:MAG TPA: 50S ribosomal protein L11 methyltransferase [Candidatus Methylomirabilis sp.]|nr:50S ribosomal protein L11 methyltransferase [Candidatus Methylomirabilis sp.]